MMNKGQCMKKKAKMEENQENQQFLYWFEEGIENCQKLSKIIQNGQIVRKRLNWMEKQENQPFQSLLQESTKESRNSWKMMKKGKIMMKKTRMDEKSRKSKNSGFWSTKIRKIFENVENDKGGSNNEQKNQTV
jgi:hypothetical protein